MSGLSAASQADTTATGPAGLRPGETGRRERRDHRPFVPLLVLVIAVLAWSGFQCYELVNERQTMAAVYRSQTRPFEESTKLRNSLDALARETAVLASKGNASAKLIVDELARRGVTINPNAAPPAPPNEGN